MKRTTKATQTAQAAAAKAAQERLAFANSPEQLADRRQNMFLRNELAELTIRKVCPTSETGFMRIPHKCFTDAERAKIVAAAYAHRADKAKIEEFIERTKAEIEKRLTPETRKYMDACVAKSQREAKERQEAADKAEALANKAKVTAAEMVAALTEEDLAGQTRENIYNALCGVLNESFVYSKQRVDGGITIYGQDSSSPSGVHSIGGTANERCMAIAGRLTKKNAYVGSQTENLNGCYGGRGC